MLAMKKLGLRSYIGTNLLLAALFANLLLFGPSLRMGGPFTAGLATGIALGWIIFAVAGRIELRRPGRSFDERQQAIFRQACVVGFWALILVSCIASILLRSELPLWKIEARDLASLVANLGLVSFFLAWVIIGRRS